MIKSSLPLDSRSAQPSSKADARLPEAASLVIFVCIFAQWREMKSAAARAVHGRNLQQKEEMCESGGEVR
jgi:hypothetical protein